MNARENIVHLKPPPPPILTKELLSIWNGWTRMSDREVVREAVVKGLHIELACSFLSARKDSDDSKTKKWIKDEVFIWVSELLTRQQIFKASHILKNLEVDPTPEFIRIFTVTFDKDLRTFLGNYLIKCDALETNLKEAWRFLQILNENDDILAGTGDEFVDFNVEVIVNKGLEWKCNLGAYLFFKTHDADLKPFLTAEKLWTCLLKQQCIDLIKIWIETSFTNDITLVPRIPEAYATLFVEFKITDDMIHLLFNQIINFSTEIQQTVLNQLSKFGIFSNYEKNNLKFILQRIINSCSLNSLTDILSSKSSGISTNQFNEVLLHFA